MTKAMPTTSKFSKHSSHIRRALLAFAFLVLMTMTSAGMHPAFALQPVDHALSDISMRSQCYLWRTVNDKPRGVIVCVHGTTQQAGCFESLAHILNKDGFYVLGMDLRGHGRWYFSHDKNNSRHTVSYSRSAQDLVNIASQVKSNCPKLPLYCIGESVGAAVTVHAAASRPDLFDGVVLASAGTSPHVFDLHMVARDFTRGITNLSRPLDVSEYITKYSSEDPRITKEMCTDPLSRTMLTGKEILQTGAFIAKTSKFATMLMPNISVLVLQGSLDNIVKSSTLGPVLENMQTTDKKMVIIPQCGHILLGTAFLKPSVVDPLCQWLIQQADTRETAAAALPGRSP